MKNDSFPAGITAHACDYCQSILIDVSNRERILGSERTGQLILVAKIDQQTVLRAVSDECKFFKSAIQPLSGRLVTQIVDEGSSNGTLPEGSLIITLYKFESTFLSVFLEWGSDFGDARNYSLGSLSMLAEEARYIGTRPTNRSPTCEEDLDLIKNWLIECESHHSRCLEAIPKTPWIPTRVVKIDWKTGSAVPSLRILSSPPLEKYAALSYCWGGDLPIKATLASIGRLSQGIPFLELPKTLRDAIFITHSLSIRFLWIDCLCIVQDDALEIAKEIATMPQIYENAHITISAARAARCADGFLHNITVPSSHEDLARLPFRGDDGAPGSVLLLKSESQDLNPLDRRAWALQEFLLSRRVLIYAEDRLSWTCVNTELHDKYARPRLFDRPRESLSKFRKLFHSSRFGDLFLSNFWEDLTSTYSRRDLTDTNDKLLAISGLASALASMVDDQYLAGLWLRSLPRALLWEVSFPWPKPCGYRAPSWSWACLDGEIENSAPRGKGEIDPDFRLLSHEVNITHPEAPFGAVKSGCLVIFGHMRKAGELDEIGCRRLGESPVDSDIPILSQMSAMDTEEAFNVGSASIWWLQICPYDPGSGIGPSGPTLITEDDIIFKRVGMFELASSEDYICPSSYSNLEEDRTSVRKEQVKWAGECQLRTVTIM